jgi:hypothetical protein
MDDSYPARSRDILSRIDSAIKGQFSTACRGFLFPSAATTLGSLALRREMPRLPRVRLVC